jgi:hypothetical protein
MPQQDGNLNGNKDTEIHTHVHPIEKWQYQDEDAIVDAEFSTPRHNILNEFQNISKSVNVSAPEPESQSRWQKLVTRHLESSGSNLIYVYIN